MTFDRASLLLNMLLILVSVGAHQAGAEEFAFFLVTVAVCVVVWRREKAGRPLQLSDTLGTIICVVAFVALMWRGISSATTGGYRMTDVGIAPVGDFLIVFQWVTLCRKRKGHDYFWMYLVTLIHMGTAGLQMPGLAYGFFFIAYAFLAISALAMSHAAREARAAGVNVAAWTAKAPATEPVAAPPRIDRPVLPGRAGRHAGDPDRRRDALHRHAADLRHRHDRAGDPPHGPAADQRLLEHRPPRRRRPDPGGPHAGHARRRPRPEDRRIPPGPVAAAARAAARRLRPGGRRLVLAGHLAARRPVVLGVRRPNRRASTSSTRRVSPATAKRRTARSPATSRSSRSTRPCSSRRSRRRASAPRKRFPVGVNTRTYVLQNGLPYRRTPLSYTVTSRLFDAAPPPKPPEHALAEEFLRPYLALPSELSPKIRALAREIAPESLRTDYEKAERILDYLSDSDRFTYTNELKPTAGVEPVEDFLFNLKRGHCEYFASSMVVLLREVNVPARLVNGFKVSEWNPISETYIVRQQHAHSWVEAYLRPYGWRTFDPTAASRDAATPAPMFARRIGGNIYDWVDSLWVAYVLNFDSSRQASPYGWLRKIAGLSEAVTASGPLRHFGIGLGASRLQPTDLGGPLYAVLLGIRWIVALLLGVGLVWVIARGFGGWRKRERRAPRRFKFYARMERMLRRRGFRRAGAQTPWEFSAALAGRQWPAAAEVAAITDRFCRARYGARPLTEADLREIEQALQAISRTR